MATPLTQDALTPAQRAALAGPIARLSTLAEVILWGLRQRPERVVLDVVVQDEFTHDVVIGWVDALHLVFDST